MFICLHVLTPMATQVALLEVGRFRTFIRDGYKGACVGKRSGGVVKYTDQGLEVNLETLSNGGGDGGLNLMV